jgi:hypothetical protein
VGFKIERLWQTLKKWLRAREAMHGPYRTLNALNHDLALFADYYNTRRPHRALHGRTPAAVFAATVKGRPVHRPLPAKTQLYRGHVSTGGTVTVSRPGATGQLHVHVGGRYKQLPVTVPPGRRPRRDPHRQPTHPRPRCRPQPDLPTARTTTADQALDTSTRQNDADVSDVLRQPVSAMSRDTTKLSSRAGRLGRMFDPSPSGLDTAALARLVGALAQLEQDVEDAVRIDRIRALEQLRSAVAAAQAVETAAFAAAQRAAQAAGGASQREIAHSVAGQVGLARRLTPHQARRYVGWAKILTGELPQTFAALRAGRVNEWRSLLVARETAWLSSEHRAVVDARLAPRLEELGDRRVEDEAKKLAYRLDPEGAIARVRGAESDRHVGLRPAPDAMARLSALLPVAQGVAVYTALGSQADSLSNEGDPRSRGQLMADLLVQRLTGQATATDVPVEINLVMSEDTLLACADEPAHLDGYGALPAQRARELILSAGDCTPMWIRRLFTRPVSGDLVALESKRRQFTPAQRRYLRLRDQTCRTPWCEAPIRHADHITAVERGGRTTTTNGRGTCAACNYTKQAAGWQTRVAGNRVPHEVEIVAPTGHRYRSRPPDPPRTRRASLLERQLRAYLRRVAQRPRAAPAHHRVIRCLLDGE